MRHLLHKRWWQLTRRWGGLAGVKCLGQEGHLQDGITTILQQSILGGGDGLAGGLAFKVRIIFLNQFRRLLGMVSIADVEHAMIRYLKTFEEYRDGHFGTEKFTDGWAFATILTAASNFKIRYDELVQPTDIKWPLKLSNLKKIVQLIEEYFEEQIHKGIRTKDIDLVEIAKNNNVEELAKLFEVVMAVMTEAHNKEDHINTIMSLDERSQSTFVEIIQNILEHRVVDRNEPKKDQLFEHCNQLQLENNLLKHEIEALFSHNALVEKENDELKIKHKDMEEELDELRGERYDRSEPLEEHKEKDHLKNMVDNLKEKLISTVRENEIKASNMKQEIGMLEMKLMKYEDIEEQLEEYKQKYSETLQSFGKAKVWEREKTKLNRIIEEKDELIKKLTVKLEEVNENNYMMQEKQLYTKMELEKRDVRFKELEKEVKKRYENSAPTGISDNSASNPGIIKLSKEFNELEQQELDQLREELELAKRKVRESERENNRLKKGMQKVTAIENEKKKLERLILDVNNDKKEQVELLLTVSHDLYLENLRLQQLVQASKIVC